ncbi:uncharacterized protein [Acropora muricata]|uniref:uncharacterized protein n=1 Tax=Acropora muricata TaxID=159855 RepID=UPI0034E37F7B
MAESCWESSSKEELFLTRSTFTVKSDEYDVVGVSTSEGNGKCLEDNAGISEGSGRFRAPISSDECRRFEDSWVSDAGRRKWNWVLNIFEEWRETVCDIGINALNAESMEERHDKVETKGESCKNIVITTAETKIEICY